MRIKALIYEALALSISTMDAEQIKRSQIDLDALDQLRPALEHIEANLHEEISVRQLAARCSMSDDHFIRRFRACLGETPMQYVLQQRIRVAAQDLLYSPASIDQIAEACGFGNRYYFTRVFTKAMGVPPAKYRRIRQR